MDAIAQTMEHQYTYIPFPAHQELEAGVERFLEFLELPEHIKRSLHVQSDKHRGSAFGYTDKRDIPGKDPKEFFHWNRALRESEPYQRLVREHDTVRNFGETAERLFGIAEEGAGQFLSEHYPELYSHAYEGGRLVRGVLRFLCYTPAPDLQFRAKPHYDKSIAAFALAESAPGLRIGCCADHPLTEVRHKPGEMIFMPGQLAHEYSGRKIIPAWHDVVHHPDTPAVNKRCARWAVVLFVDDKDGYYPEWDAVHTPIIH